MIREAAREDKVKKVRVREPVLEPLRTGYEVCGTRFFVIGRHG